MFTIVQILQDLAKPMKVFCLEKFSGITYIDVPHLIEHHRTVASHHMRHMRDLSVQISPTLCPTHRNQIHRYNISVHTK